MKSGCTRSGASWRSQMRSKSSASGAKSSRVSSSSSSFSASVASFQIGLVGLCWNSGEEGQSLSFFKNLMFGGFDSETKEPHISKRRQAPSLTRSGSQQRPKHDSNFNPRRGLIPTKNSKGNSLEYSKETLVWDHQTMGFLYVLGLSRILSAFNGVTKRKLRRAHLKKKYLFQIFTKIFFQK